MVEGFVHLFVRPKLEKLKSSVQNTNSEDTEGKIIQIKQRMQAAHDRQKSYADLKRKPMEFQVGDKVMLKVLPWKGVVRFGKWGKLNPRYVGPFKVLEKVGEVAYKLELPEELSRVHNIFHVSNLKKCYADEPLAVLLDGLNFDDKLQFVEEPVEIIDREVKRLMRSHIPLVKVASDDLRDALSVIYLTYAHSSYFEFSDSVMSDSDESGVTYTEVSSPFEDLSDIGSPRADDHEYLELPWMPEDPYVEAALQAPPSPDYVPGPEEPEQAPPSPDYVPGPEHADDEIVAEDQPYAEDASPTAQSPNYAPSVEETEPFETDESAATPPPHPAYRVTARISIPAPVPTPVWSDAEVARLLAISTPPSSPLSPWSSPLPQIPSPSLPLSPPSPVLSPAPPPSPIRSLGYRAAMIRMRAEAASTSHSLPLPPPFILSPTRLDVPSLGIPPPLPISRLGIALGPGYEVGDSSYAAAARPAGGLRADYGFIATMDRESIRDPEREIGYGITDSQDKDEVYTRLDDEQSPRQLLAGRLNMLFRDRRAHAYTRHQMEIEARLSREAWRRSMDASDLAREEVMSLRTTVMAQMSKIRELHDANRRRQAVISKILKVDQRRSTEMRELRITDHTRQQQLIHTLTVMQSLQREVTQLLGQVTTL
ncbi:hypothetical protein Tco_0945812 [Tanacetum coccineum]